MNLKSSPKTYNNYKCDHPRNTIKKIQEGFKKIGLKLEYRGVKIGSSRFSIYVGESFIDVLGIVQYGKGITRELSKASAYAEMVERFSAGAADIRIPFPKKQGKYVSILKDVNERRFLRGYVKKDIFPSPKSVEKYFYKKVDKEQFNYLKKLGTMHTLVDAYSIQRKTYEKVPIDLIEMYSNTNGLAAGNTIEEAIAQASFEIFERYSARRIISERIVCPSIDPDSINDEYIRDYIELLESTNIKVIIKDFTLNNSIPVIGVLFINNNLKYAKNELVRRNYRRINVGAHVDLNEAIRRCFNENFQLIGMEREDDYTLYRIWTKILKKKYVGTDNEFRYFIRKYDYRGDLSFLEKGKKINFENLKSYRTNDSLKDVEKVNEICKDNGWDILVIDYTHKIIQFPTVRVIIPPISVSSYLDPFMERVLKINDFETKFNYFYGINDFYRYLKDDSWINDKNKIKLLIKNIEEYLSKNLCHYYFYLNRESNFSQLVNVFHIMPFLYLSIDKYNEARKYFQALIELDFHPPINLSFYKSLYQTKYNPKNYRKYIDLIDKSTENEINYKLKTNPFDPERCSEEEEKMYFQLLKRINDSYMGH